MFYQTVQIIQQHAKRWVGLLLFVVCAIAIYFQVAGNQNWAKNGQVFIAIFAAIPFFNWVVLVLLMFLNLYIESYKWKLLVDTQATISISKAIRSVYVGQAFAFFTPNRVGEYAGRTLLLPAGKRVQGLGQMAWASYAQLVITMFIGSVALFWKHPFFEWMRWLSPLLVLISLFLFFYDKEWKGIGRFLNQLQIPVRLKWQLLGYSFVRYLVFTTQYVWAANMLGMDISLLEITSAVAILFLFLAILPTVSLTELVVRGQLLLLLLSPLYTHAMLVLALSTLIWLVNFLLPAIIGSLLLLGYSLNQ
jgi:hypothetical protein